MTVTLASCPFVLSNEPDVIFVAVEILALFVTVPAISVVPAPVTLPVNSPPVNVNSFAEATLVAPAKLPAFVSTSSIIEIFPPVIV